MKKCENCGINNIDKKSNDLNLCLDCYNFDLNQLTRDCVVNATSSFNQEEDKTKPLNKNEMIKVLVYNDDLTEIKIVIFKGKKDKYYKRFEKYENYLILNDKLQKQLKKEVMEKL